MDYFAAAAKIGPEQLVARWDTLPDPVRRYLHYAIPAGAGAVAAAHLRHGGTFRAGPDQGWMTVHGEQHFSVATPGFVWRARIWPAKVVWIDACDRLTDGHGRMLVKLLSIVPIADASGPRIDQSASLRWLGECAWFPYAFVGDQIDWTPIDAHAARATLRQADYTASAVFHIDDDGRLTSFEADRYRDVGGGNAVLTPFVGRFGEYRAFNGFRAPSAVEGSWMLDSGEFTYARFEVQTLEYA